MDHYRECPRSHSSSASAVPARAGSQAACQLTSSVMKVSGSPTVELPICRLSGPREAAVAMRWWLRSRCVRRTRVRRFALSRRDSRRTGPLDLIENALAVANENCRRRKGHGDAEKQVRIHEALSPRYTYPAGATFARCGCAALRTRWSLLANRPLFRRCSCMTSCLWCWRAAKSRGPVWRSVLRRRLSSRFFEWETAWSVWAV